MCIRDSASPTGIRVARLRLGTLHLGPQCRADEPVGHAWRREPLCLLTLRGGKREQDSPGMLANGSP
eukprot:11685148-Alexandrium_andersonii.AAC.1